MSVTRLSPLVQAALLILAAELVFTLMGVTVRMLSAGLGNAQIVFFRSLIASLLLLPWFLRSPAAGTNLKTAVPGLHLLRGVAGLGAVYCFFYVLAHLPLADAMLLKMTAPLFIPFVAFFWLGESIPWRVRWALLVGFIGVLLVLSPSFSGGANHVAWVALAGGVFAALAKVTVRRLGRTEPATRTVFYFALICTLGSFPAAWQAGDWPGLQWLPTLLALGALSTTAQLLLTRGLALAPAGRLAPFTYFAVLYASLFGWLLWDEVPTWSTAVGAAAVIGAGIMAGRRTARERADARSLQPAPSVGGAG